MFLIWCGPPSTTLETTGSNLSRKSKLITSIACFPAVKSSQAKLSLCKLKETNGVVKKFLISKLFDRLSRLDGRSNHTVKCIKFLTLSRKSHHPIQNPAFPCEVREIFRFFKVNRYLVYFIESNIS